VIAASELDKTFVVGKKQVHTLRSVTFDVAAGEFLAVIGASGSGKTTLIRSIAGLERPEGGVIRLRDKVVFDAASGLDVPPQQRRLGMVFQSYAIWPHLSVLDNVMLPLIRGQHRMATAAARVAAQNALDLVGIGSLADRPSPLLSGGQQQRVALARALAVSADVLLMDEPLSNLDAQLREEVRRELKSLAHQLGATILYVTHDLSEAMALADRLLILDKGAVLQIGAPADVYRRPASRGLADFLGRINWFEGTCTGNGTIDTSLGGLKTTWSGRGRGAVSVGIRPEHISLRVGASLSSSNTLANSFPATVISVQFLGAYALVDVDAGGERLLVEWRGALLLSAGDTIVVALPVEELLVFEQATSIQA
jgi:ABC-type Fe3+/spermidine/putrescine transport system ATPase subunit